MSDYLKFTGTMIAIIAACTAYATLLAWLSSLWGIWVIITGLLLMIIVVPAPLFIADARRKG